MLDRNFSINLAHHICIERVIEELAKELGVRLLTMHAELIETSIFFHVNNIKNSLSISDCLVRDSVLKTAETKEDSWLVHFQWNNFRLFSHAV